MNFTFKLSSCFLPGQGSARTPEVQRARHAATSRAMCLLLRAAQEAAASRPLNGTGVQSTAPTGRATLRGGEGTAD